VLDALKKAQNITDVLALGNTSNKHIGSMAFRTQWTDSTGKVQGAGNLTGQVAAMIIDSDG